MLPCQWRCNTQLQKWHEVIFENLMIIFQCQSMCKPIAAYCTICCQWQTLVLLAIYRNRGLDQLCRWTVCEEGEDGGWHEAVLVFGKVGMSVWGLNIKLVLKNVAYKVEEGREKGRMWIERVDVMQPLSAITQVLCCRLFVARLSVLQMYISKASAQWIYIFQFKFIFLCYLLACFDDKIYKQHPN